MMAPSNVPQDLEGLLAASLYEPLTPEEQALLEDALAQSGDLRADHSLLQGLVADLQETVPPLDIDLLPAIRAQIAREDRPSLPFAWRRFAVPALAAAAAIVVMLSLAARTQAPGTPAPGAPVQVASSVPATPLGVALASARAALEQREYGNAVRTLREGLAAHPGDAESGAATLLLADLEFSQLQRYDEAYTVYETLRTQHPAVFSNDPAAIQRFDLLAEARTEDYAPLHALSAAGDSFDALERVVSLYPNKLVGALAMNTMQRLECAGRPEEPASEIAALESVRERCNNPIALAQVNLSLGELYWNAQQNPGKAREAFLAVTASGHTGSAQLARQALAQLDATPVP
jgi:tetratricopeptide (TPR) repeat protein